MSVFQTIIQKYQKNQRERKSNLGEIKKEIANEFLPDNPTILEAGAHIGRNLTQLAILLPEDSNFAFEPVSEIFQQLVVNTRPTVMSSALTSPFQT